LSKNKDMAFDLLRKAITKPHFEESAFERVKKQFLVSAANDAQDPEKIASKAWMEMAFPGTPYARGSDGTEASIKALTAQDLRDAHGRVFVRQGLHVAVVGDIDAASLGALLDKTFGGLPEGAPAPAKAIAPKAGPQFKAIARDIPQSIIVFGAPGILRSDPAFIPSYIMMEILGGGGFGSRLTNEVREKRGLTYGVGYGLAPLDRAGITMGSLGTRNEKATN
jgi:zinc protease